MNRKYHVKKFETQSDYETQIDDVLEKPYVIMVEEGKKIICKKKIIYSKEYFTIINTGTEILKISVSVSNSDWQYKLKGKNWSKGCGKVVSLTPESEVQFKCELKQGDVFGTFKLIGDTTCSVQGNIMSLVFGDDFIEQTDLTGYNYVFWDLFDSCTTLTDASNLILPATTLAKHCYYQMFKGCTSLTTAPELPATTLADYCYDGMFYGCTSLTVAPELPATTLAESCYQYMFYNCTSLTVAPELPATTLADWCYGRMFYNCSSLTTAPALLSTTLVDCCYNSMFYGCTSLTVAPILLATTLVDWCYYYMFQGCTSLSQITMLATDISANDCLSNWVYGVASSGTFTKHPDMTSLPSGVNGIPTGWVVEDNITITSCKSLVITANDVLYNLTSATIYWTAICEGELNGEIIEITKTGIATSESFEQNLTDSNIERTISFTYMGVTATTTITHKFMPTNFQNYFSIKNTGNNTLSVQLKKSSAIPINYIKYGDGDWTTSSEAISIGVGEEVYFKGNLTPNSGYGIGTFKCTGDTTCSVQGNVMSLLFGDDFEGKTDLSGKNYAFYNLFNGNTTLTDASNLLLPATKLASSCYYKMFSNCTSLVTAPALPATTLAERCYYWMFTNCTSLTEVPELPATTLTDSCYYEMFNGTNVLPDCSNIDFSNEKVVASGGLSGLFAGTKVTDVDLERILPKNSEGKYCLPATTLASSCYYEMFSNCTSLVTAPELPATTLAEYCYRAMFDGCTSLTVAPELPATTLAEYCYRAMFDGCTSLTVAPELPATTLASSCYYEMFSNCTSLVTAPELPATTLATYCYQYMFHGCTSLTVAPELPATTLTHSCYNGMFYGCTSLTKAPELPATELAYYCYYSMFCGCTSLAEAPDLPATELKYYCYQHMFDGCTSLTEAPALPATTLKNYCYYSMFKDCVNINRIVMLATDISASNCLYNWMKNVASSGVFIKHSDMNDLPSGVSGIPDGWTVEDYVN